MEQEAMTSPGRHINSFCRYALLLFALPLIVCDAYAECTNEWLGVDEIREGGNIELRATNLREYPITFTLRVRTRGLSTDGPKTITQTLQGEQAQTIMVLRENDADQEGRYRVSCEWTVGNKDANHDDDQIYVFPYANGRSYRVLQGYGSRFSHRGLEQFAIDFKMDEGTAVHAARDGVVARIEEANSIGCWEDGCGKYANYIVILHNDGTTGEYYHLQENGALVDVGDQVKAGQKIGLSGNTGHTTMPHLHFAVYRAASWGNTQSIPVRFMSGDGVVNTPRRGGRYRAVPIASTSD
jgi:murein DD-endopeptidase MepM/ murein hydrolase activator NlpD